jgi:sugar lactone lactonase YvrE
LSSPQGLAVDAFGNLIIADSGNSRIREVGADGIITTVAGNGAFGYSGDGGAAINGQLDYPTGVAVDAFGNLFIADRGNDVIRKVGTDGIITTVAGDGTNGYFGDGRAATEAELWGPEGVAVDAFGNLFIADRGNDVIRKVGTNGIITTVAGNGTYGYSGDGGSAIKAEFSSPTGVAVDASGDLFIADSGNFRIREVGTNGIISTLVATEGISQTPTGVAVDAVGHLFIADPHGSPPSRPLHPGPPPPPPYSAILEVETDGRITTVAGNGTTGYSGDGGPATNAELNYPENVAVDASGNLFIADSGNNRIRKVVLPSPTLVLNDVTAANAGEYDVVVSSPYGSVTSSVLTLLVLLPPAIVAEPQNAGVALGSNATLSVAATGTAPLEYQWYFEGAALRGQTSANLPLSAVAFTNGGSYNVVVTNLYGSITSAVAVVTVGLPPGIVAQPASQTNLFGDAVAFSVAVSGTGPFTYQWQLNGANLTEGVITTMAGDGMEGYSGDGGPATKAELNLPSGVALDASGNLFIADNYNSRIRKVATNGIITTVAGNGKYGYSGDGGPATKAELTGPSGVALDASGNLFIADTDNSVIRKVATNGIITTVAGNGKYGYSGDGGPATKAELTGPFGVTLDASGNLFIADSGNFRIREVGTNGIITTVAGNGFRGCSGDAGPATNAKLCYPQNVAVDAFGNLLIADTGTNVIREVGTDGIITTVAGNGRGGYSGDGGAATSAELSGPSGVAVDAFGNLFIADTSNERLRKVGTDGIITTVAGNGKGGYAGDKGAATKAEMYGPSSVTVDASGNLFIADENNMCIRKVVFQGPTLVLSNVSGANVGEYDVVVSSPYGSVTSSVVSLVVTLNPLSAQSFGGQEVQLQFQGVAGHSYDLLSAANLTPPVDWSAVVSKAADTRGNWTFTVTNALSDKAVFYRISTAGQ